MQACAARARQRWFRDQASVLPGGVSCHRIRALRSSKRERSSGRPATSLLEPTRVETAAPAQHRVSKSLRRDEPLPTYLWITGIRTVAHDLLSSATGVNLGSGEHGVDALAALAETAHRCTPGARAEGIRRRRGTAAGRCMKGRGWSKGHAWVPRPSWERVRTRQPRRRACHSSVDGVEQAVWVSSAISPGRSRAAFRRCVARTSAHSRSAPAMSWSARRVVRSGWGPRSYRSRDSRIGRISSASRSRCNSLTYGCPVKIVTSTLRARATAATKSAVAGRAPHSTWLSRL